MAKDGWLELESDPGVFTLLAKALGIKGIQVEEIYDLSRELTDRVYGYIFLFCWSDDRRSRRRQNAITEDMQIRDQERLRRMFFARQVITNSCATHALLSVVLNSPGVALGQTLAKFKQSTRDMDAENKGLAIGNVPEFAYAHNRHSRPEPISASRLENNGAVLGRSVEAYHYISFVPVDGHLVELDGLKAHPVDHGPIPEGEDWSVMFRQVMKDRLGSCFGEANQDIRYNLLALVDDRIDMSNKRLEALEAEREKLLATVEKTFCSLVGSPVTSPIDSPSHSPRGSVFSDPPSNSRTASVGMATASQAGALSPTTLFPVAPATQALVPEPMVLLAESHAQPVCALSTATARGEVAAAGAIVQPALAAGAATATDAAPAPHETGNALVGSDTAALEPEAKRPRPADDSPSLPSRPDPASAAVTAVAPSSVAAVSSSAQPLPTSSDSVFTGPPLDAHAVSAALQSSLSTTVSVTQSDATAGTALSSSYAAGAAAMPSNVAAFHGLATLAALAPSPMPGSPVRGALSSLTPSQEQAAGSPGALLDDSLQAAVRSMSCGARGDGESASSLASGGDASSQESALLASASLAGGYSAAVGEMQNVPFAKKASDGSDGSDGDALKRSCAVLATSLTAYSVDAANSLSASGTNTPRTASLAGGGSSSSVALHSAVGGGGGGGSSLGLDDSRGADVTRAAHLLVNVLRQSSAASEGGGEQAPQTTAMLEDAVEPLRRDDPQTHTRVKDIFKELGNLDGEIASCRKELNEEEIKRQRYKIDHSRRTHNYGPFITTFLVMLAKEGVLQQAIEAEHPHRYHHKRSNSISLPSAAGGSAATASSTTAAPQSSSSSKKKKPPGGTGAKRGRPPGSKTQKKKLKLPNAGKSSGKASQQSRQATDGSND